MSIPEDNRLVELKKWTCLVQVKPRPNSEVLGKARRAFAAAVIIAAEPSEFTQRLSEALDRYELDLVSVEDVAVYDERAKADATPQVEAIAEQLDEETPVGFGSFHTFPDDD